MAERTTNTRRTVSGIVSFLALAAILALFFEYRHQVSIKHPPRFSVSLRHLPYYAFCSFYRMLAAYIISLIFSIIYGLAATRGRLWERVLIPAVDIAQSVPVVGFFPAAVFFFVALAHGSRLGVEMAAVFLIFTSQAWNMTLGVFEAIRTIPTDSIEALQAFGVRGWLRLRRLYLPAMVPKLVYNSILSWVAGWYFLIACEIITVGPAHYRLPGLGSYLMEAADRGETMNLISGLITLLIVITLMDIVVWQPLTAWSEKFKYEFAASGQSVAISFGMTEVFRAIGPRITRAMRSVTLPVSRALWQVIAALPQMPSVEEVPALGTVGSVLRMIAIVVVAGFFTYGITDGFIALFHTLAQPWPAQVKEIPLATLYSALRMIIAYAISLAWTLPVALAASDNARFRRVIAPIAEIVGSLPATALFPVIVVFVIKVTGGMNLASILLILTGMQWYLMFNLLAGVNQVPEDLKEAARAFGLTRIETWRKLTIPALTPSLITGSITAWGGGWNALILSEYFIYRNHTYQVTGLGQLLDVATYETGNGVMILLSLLSMIAVVLVLNHFVWRRLYDVAAERYRIDY
jgi:NitT/TauT family transport system permease protein